jgi:hypothetical protein
MQLSKRGKAMTIFYLPLFKMKTISKHEILLCEHCHVPFECKANSSTYCQCTQVELTLEEAEYISERYDSCLCAKCLSDLKHTYHKNLKTP